MELERLNGFPDNHTEGVTDGTRAFFMGNALVCGIVSNLANQLSKYLSPQVYQNIFSDSETLNTTIKRKNLTIFFSDIEKFTDPCYFGQISA